MQPTCVFVLNLRRTLLQRPAGTFRVLAFCMQYDGGGLIVYGTATLTNTNVYENVANVRLHFEPPKPYSSAPLERFVCSPFAHRVALAAGYTSLA